jgi:hypothetical protein
MSHQHAAGATGAGTVILELGGDVGVLILDAPALLLGHEIEISPVDGGSGSGADPGHRTHSMVRERVTGSGTSYAAVYPGVPAGRYIVWRDADTPAGTVTIAGGEVARFTLATTKPAT